MHKSKKLLLPEAILDDRLKWLKLAYEEFQRGGATAYLRNFPPVELLISGLRQSDAVRWDIGIIDASVLRDPSDDSPSLSLTYGKPGERREAGEADWTIRRFDPPAALVQQLHILFGGHLRLRTSSSHVVTPDHPKGIPYHYPLIGIAVGPSKRVDFRVLRGILNAPPDRLANAHEHFHDLRRCKLTTPWLTQQGATARYGAQKNGRYSTRGDAIEASLRAYHRKQPFVDLTLGAEELRAALTQAYELLDCHPLKHNHSSQ